MKYTYHILSLALLVGCSSQQIRPSQEDISSIKTLLETTYKEQKRLKQAIPLCNPDITLEAKEVLESFWNPKNLNQYGEDIQHDLYTTKEYLIIQTHIRIAERNDYQFFEDIHIASYEYKSHRLDENEWSFHVCSNVYANIKIQNSKVLYLTPKLEANLESFLGEEFTEFGTPNIMSTSQAEGMSAQRLASVNKFLTIIPGHWGKGWHLISHPEVNMILFNRNHTKAIVAFRIGYGGGFASLSKQTFHWELDESTISWIE